MRSATDRSIALGALFEVVASIVVVSLWAVLAYSLDASWPAPDIVVATTHAAVTAPPVATDAAVPPITPGSGADAGR